jgi:hypothetical protein
MERNTGLPIICPGYNEQGNIDMFSEHVEKVLPQLSLDYEIMFVSDGRGASGHSSHCHLTSINHHASNRLFTTQILDK